jgi:4-amino-4-deoxy-L-arabinose transferase-like glycosyltransferase
MKRAAWFPYFSLLLWVLPLVLVRSGQQSLMAHDEGIYAVQAKAILETGNWLAPQWAGEVSFDRTIGMQWLIALSYRLLGLGEEAVRLPSSIGYVLSSVLLLRLGSLTIGPRLGWIGAAIFAVVPLVAHYARLGTQDMVLVCIEVVAVWALLEGEQVDRKSWWPLVTGVMFGWGFLIKGFMVLPAAVALLPYLLLAHRRHGHLGNPWLYLGGLLGLVPGAGWLWAAIGMYGTDRVWGELLGKLLHLKGQTYQGAGPLYYFWNIPANGFPWAILGAIGGVLIWKKSRDYRWLLVGGPLLLFLELCLFGTKTPYYPLQLMPGLALLAAVALDELRQKGLRWVMAGLGLMVLGAAAILGFGWVHLPPEWATVRWGLWGTLVVLGVNWLAAGWRGNDRRTWLVGLLAGPWFVVFSLNAMGLWGNFSGEVKDFTNQIALEGPACRVNFVVDESQLSRRHKKEYLLLNFYTPSLGNYFNRLPQSLEGCWLIDPNWANQLPPNLGKALSPKGWRWVRWPANSARKASPNP